jgi:N-methylhydantoinase B
MSTGVTIAAGQVLTMHAAGGAGYGDPLRRDPAFVQRDVQDGFVSVEAARREYGVVLDPRSLRIDSELTQILRAERLEDD